jgi:hypothetical protein
VDLWWTMEYIFIHIYMLLFVCYLQMWSLFNFLNSAHPVKCVESVSALATLTGQILLLPFMVIIRMIGSRGDLQLHMNSEPWQVVECHFSHSQCFISSRGEGKNLSERNRMWWYWLNRHQWRALVNMAVTFRFHNMMEILEWLSNWWLLKDSAHCS